MKRQYSIPLFEEIIIDNTISLVMMTGNGGGDPPNDPEFSNKKENDKDKDNALESPFK
jgi:hypothetical protein